MSTPPAASSGGSVFVTAHIDLTGARGSLLGREGAAQTATGELPAPRPGLVLWRVLERIAVERELTQRVITPAPDGQTVSYAYTVKGGAGGLFPLNEPGRFQAELVAVYAPPSYLREVGEVEILSTSHSCETSRGKPAEYARAKVPTPGQLEGRLIRVPGEEAPAIWFVEGGVKRRLESPSCGRLRFGDGWQRLIQSLPSADAAHIVPDGAPLTLAEAAAGRLIHSWPDETAYWVQEGRKRRIDNPAPVVERFGDHWRIALIHLRRAELDAIPDGEPITEQ